MMRRTMSWQRVVIVVMAAGILVASGSGLAPRTGIAAATPQAKRAMTAGDLLLMKRIAEPEISPNAQWVSYTLAVPDMNANRLARNVWIVPAAGGDSKQLTTSGRDQGARWSPDGARIAFISSRDGGAQIWLMNATGGEATKLTTLSGDADNIVWSPDGKWIAFTLRVYPDCPDEACNKKRDADREKNPVKARVYDRLLYRHWTEWWDGKRSHLFVIASTGGAPRDLIPAADYDTPAPQREGAHPIAWSPDGKEICFTAVTDKMEATSTNGDLFTVAPDGSTKEPKRLTASNLGFDAGPAYSPDGKWLAYRSQPRAGYEADKWRLMLMDRTTGQPRDLTLGIARSVDQLAWSPDSQWIYFNAEWQGQMPVYRTEIIARAAGSPIQPQAVMPQTYNGEFSLSKDGKTLVAARQSAATPVELYVAAGDGSASKQLTRVNAQLLAQLDLSRAEHFTFEGAPNPPPPPNAPPPGPAVEVHGMLLRPPNFDPAKKYPILMVMHGGPQTMFGDAWSYRWNAQTFAAPGYAVLMINRRGSTGFGQGFTDDIRADWGGKAYQDLMLGLEAALKKWPFLDGERVAAAGASYGGFMADWMASQSKGRFKAIISHAGVYNFESMYGATEELWFVEWDLKGMPWTNRADYERQSPNRFAADFGKFKTPTLVIAGELDFRVPYTQSLEFYTALQRQGVPSKLVLFPDEGHWILKPQNAAFWYSEVLGWLKTYLK